MTHKLQLVKITNNAFTGKSYYSARSHNDLCVSKYHAHPRKRLWEAYFIFQAICGKPRQTTVRTASAWAKMWP